MNKGIEIKLSKKKLTLLFIAGVTFVTYGCLFIRDPENFTSPICRNPEIIRITGIAAVSFFGVGLIIIIKKFFDNKPGLIINEFGITDNSNASSVGLIEWSDVKGFERVEILSTKILLVLIKNPKKYIARAKNTLAKKSMEANNKRYGSPISIVSNSLKINFEELERLVKDEWEKQKASH